LTRLATQKRQRLFLEELRHCGLVCDAAAKAGISRALPYLWAKNSESFADEFQHAKQEGEQVLADTLEAALRNRATEGWSEDVYYQGKKVGSQRRYSDTAAIVMLKACRPHKYVEQLVGLNINGQAISIKIANFAAPIEAEPLPKLVEQQGESAS
jgi:hypothetical protein